MILKQGSLLALAGIAIGLIGALAVARLLDRFHYGIRPTDPLTFVGVTVLQ
jgi:putative ABC transport system permease protein